MPFRLRKLWLKIHLYLGLTVGWLFAFAGLTGSLVIFDHALDERLNAGMMLPRSQGEWRSLADIVTAARAVPELSGRAASVAYPRVPQGAFSVYFKSPGNPPLPQTEVFVDPVSAQVLGQRVRGSGVMTTILQLHSSLLAGQTGKTILGIMALLVLVSLVTGILLWWPLLKAGLRPAFAIRPRKLHFDLHKTIGIFLAPVFLLITFTGVYLTLPGIVKPVVRFFSAETKLPQNVKSGPPTAGKSALTPDQAASVATATMPGCRLMSVELPAGPADAYRVFVRQTGEVGQLRGVGRVWVDQYSGQVLATRDWNRFTFAETYFRIQLALHCGDAFGLPGRWLFCLAGLMPSVLAVTGTVLWWRKRPFSRKQSRILRRELSPPEKTLSSAVSDR